MNKYSLYSAGGGGEAVTLATEMVELVWLSRASDARQRGLSFSVLRVGQAATGKDNV